MGAAARYPETEPILETGEPELTVHEQEVRSIGGSLWMLGITLALFFLPVVNGLIGGVVGGFRAGSTKGALLASILPVGAAAFLLWIILSYIQLPVMGSPADAIQIALLTLLSIVAMVVGAAIGGTVAQNRIDRLNRA
ncbi:MAG TPA: hypothetical protein VIH99_10290 [Bdellovibrionota bacterium]|jgi:hypothetical protein